MRSKIVVIGILAGLLSCLWFSQNASQERSFTVRVPADFERSLSLVVAYEKEPIKGERNETLAAQRNVLDEIISACHTNVDITVLVSSEEAKTRAQQKVEENGVQGDKINFVDLDFNSLWIRDFGAIEIVDSSGAPKWLDFEYFLPGNSWIDDGGNYTGRPADDDAFKKFATLSDINTQKVPLVLHGGAIASNGNGLILISEAVFEWNHHRFDYDEKTTRGLFEQYFPGNQIEFIPPLQGEPTGHLDIFLVFVGEQTVLIGELDSAHDEFNKYRLDRIASRLKDLSYHGDSLNVRRIPMPIRGQQGTIGTYTNVVFANGKLLMPIYTGDESFREQAKAIYREVLPDWEIVEFHSDALMAAEGALHCVTWNNKVQKPDSSKH